MHPRRGAIRPRAPARALLLSLVLLPLPGGARAQAPSGWIEDGAWLLLGPLDNPAGCSPSEAAMGENWIAPATIAGLAPAAGEPIEIDFSRAASAGWEGVGDVPTWVSLAELGLSGHSKIDLRAAAAALAERSGESIPDEQALAVLASCVTYNGTEPLPINVCDSSDDSIQIWINNARVQNVSACRPASSCCSEKAEALLVPGKNAIKVLVWQGIGDWGFRLRLELPDGSVITDAHPQFRFGTDFTDSVILEDYFVDRRIGVETPGCALRGDLEVALRGAGTGGIGAVTLTESIGGSFEILDTGGGLILPALPPVRQPVGIFMDARDIGMPCAKGSTVLGPGLTYTVGGSGSGIWRCGDQFHFAHLEASGDFVFTARVARRYFPPGSRLGRAGIMARQDLTAASRFAMIQIAADGFDGSTRFATRTTHGNGDNAESILAGQRDWLRLGRIGNVFTGEVSVDGSTWEPGGIVDWGRNAPTTVLLGLAITSGTGCDPAEVAFEQVELAGGNAAKPPAAPAGGTIVWNLPRELLDQGIRYRIRGQGPARFSGHDQRHATRGDREAMVLREDAPSIGEFEFAHDIGSPCNRGDTSFDPAAGTYRQTASGNDIWEGNDQFQYAYLRIAGDFSLRARIVERRWAEDTRWGKGGLMARATCDPDSRYFFIHDSPDPDDTRVAVQRLDRARSNQEYLTGRHADWIRLDRLGGEFAAYISRDGDRWEPIHHEELEMPESVLLGLATTAHAGCRSAQVIFDQVELRIPDFRASRSSPSADASGCRGEDGAVEVEIQGEGARGPDLRVEETILGAVAVSGISAGGAFTPIPAPEPWGPAGIFAGTTDIGDPCGPGSTTLEPAASYSLAGSGGGIGRSGDQFHIAYLPASGDFELTARVAARQWTDDSRWGAAGIMARENHDSRSRYAMIQTHVAESFEADRFAGRPTHGGGDDFAETPLEPGERRDWMRLERKGSIFRGFFSKEGVFWKTIGWMDWGPTAPATVMLGLAVTSSGNCATAAVTFDSIRLEGGAGPLQPLTPIGGTIAWEAAREEILAGLRYRIAGRGIARSAGFAGDLLVIGADDFPLVPIQVDGLGSFDIARDIGLPCLPGRSAFVPLAGVYQLAGSGTDIGADGDQFHFLHRFAGGDFSLTAHIRQREWVAGSRWGKAGIMVREDCSPRSRHAMIQTHGEDSRDADRFAGRPTHGGTDHFEMTPLMPGEQRDWMQLVRLGSLIAGYVSLDGQAWEEIGRVDWGSGAPAGALIGLAVSSHERCAAARIQFDQVMVSDEVNHPPVPRISTMPSDATVFLYPASATAILDGGASDDGDGGGQMLSFLWSKIAGPDGDAIEAPRSPVTAVEFAAPGVYKYELTVDDGQPVLHRSRATVSINVLWDPYPHFRRGDADINGRLEITDPIVLLGYLFLGDTRPSCFDAADADDNGELEITDAVLTLGFLFLGGEGLPPPGSEACGLDLTEDFPGADFGCTYPAESCR